MNEELEVESLKQRKYLAMSALTRLNPQLREAEATLTILKLTWEHWHRIHEDADRKLTRLDGRHVKVTHAPYQPESKDVPIDQMGVDELESLVSSLKTELQRRDE